MPTSDQDCKVSRRMLTSRSAIWFLCGLVVGGTAIMLISQPEDQKVMEQRSTGETRAPPGSLSPNSPHLSIHEPRPRRTNAAEFSEETPADPKARLKAQLFDYAVSETLAGFLSGLKDEESNLLATALEDFRVRLNEHEAHAAEITYDSPEKVSMFVPALFVGSDAASKFRDELAEALSPELADGFMNAAARDLDSRFAFWGTAVQEIDIDLTRDPAYVTQRIKNEGRLATYGTEYNGAGHRFAHFFEIVDPEEVNPR